MKFFRFLAVMMLWFLVGGCIPPTSEGLTSPPEDLEGLMPYSREATTGTLANGLGYVLVPHAEAEGFVEWRLILDAGRRQGRRDMINEAHLVEHLIFRQTADHPALAALEREGNTFGRDHNGFVSAEHMLFILRSKASPESVDSSVRLLAAWTGPLDFGDEDFEKERRIIADEYRLRQSVQFEDDGLTILEGLGKLESVLADFEQISAGLEEITIDELRRFHHRTFRPERAVVVIAGDVDPDVIQDALETHFGGLRPTTESSREPPSPTTTHAERIRPFDYEIGSSEVLTFENPSPPGMNHLRSRAELREILVERLALDAIDRRLDTVKSYSIRRQFRDIEIFFTDDEADLSDILEELRRLELHGLRDWEKRQVEESFEKTLRATLSGNRDDVLSLADAIVRQVVGLSFEPISDQQLDEMLELVSGISRRELEARIRDWTSNRFGLLVTPGSDVDLEDLRTTAERLRTARVKPPKRKKPKSNAVELADEFKMGEILHREPMPLLNAELWQLSNGARLVIKRTPQGPLRLIGHSPGGRSLVLNRDVPEASLLAKRFHEQMTAHFPGIGQAFFRITVDYQHEQIDISVAPTGFDLLLEKAGLPEDEDDLQRFEGYLQGVVGFTASWPAYFHLGHQLLDFRDGHHPWQIPSLEILRAADAMRASAILRDRFRNAADFIFVFTGPFEDEQAEEIARRLAGWSSGRIREKAVDRARPFADPFDVDAAVAKSSWTIHSFAVPPSDSGAVGILFAGNAEWDLDGQIALEIVTLTLVTWLRERLRDELGETYLVVGQPAFDRKPRERFGLAVVASCAPGTGQKLLDEVFTATRELVTGIDEGSAEALAALESARGQTALNAERGQSSSDHWARHLELMMTAGLAPEEIVDIAARIQNMPSDELRRRANGFLSERRAILAVADPAKTE